MPELTLAAAVTRTELGLTDLDINDIATYELAKQLNNGTVSWRKEIAQSPFYEGRFVVHEVKDAVEMSLIVYVHGESYPVINTRVQTLLEAFTEQYSYDLKITVNGQQHTWTCERADYDVAFATETVNALKVPVQLTTMRHPSPVAGAF